MLCQILTDKFQSAEEWTIDINTVFIITIVRTRRGGARKQWNGNINSTRSIINMKDDAMCAARSLVHLQAKEQSMNYDLVKGHGSALQKERATALHHSAAVPIRPDGVTFNNLNSFAEVLQAQVCVIDEVSVLTKCFTYKTRVKYDRKYILYYSGIRPGTDDICGHFHAVTNIAPLFGVRKYCMDCEKGLTGNSKHVCGAEMCPICKSSECDIEQPFDPRSKSNQWSMCNACNRKFPSPLCFQQHLDIGTCDKVWKCLSCNRNVRGARDKHVCGEHNKTKCRHCKVEVDITKHHTCYITAVEVVDEVALRAEPYIFFDFETTQYLGPHVVNLAVAMYAHSDEPFVFKDLTSFCEWLFREEHSKCTVFAHNGRGYDFQFIRAWCVSQGRKLTWISNGLKIMTMEDEEFSIKFLDSINFITMPLANFTKTFNLTTSKDGHELKKGFFPHFFNTPKNIETYIGDVPEFKYFGYSTMKSSGAQDSFIKWHAERQAMVDAGKPYNLKEEFIEYCVSDVRLLKVGCLTLKELFVDTTHVNPFNQVTIASTCMAVYRTNYMPPEKIVRYAPRSESAPFMKQRMEWLLFKASAGTAVIRYPEWGKYDELAMVYNGEKLIKAYFFQSDYMHGNLELYSGDMYNKSRRLRMTGVSRQRLETLRGCSTVPVECIWQSTWINMKKTDKEVKQWVQDPLVQASLPVEPLNPRNAFHGGRTNAAKLQYTFDVAAGEKGYYYDVNSLYPAVNYYDPYPCGNPTMYINTGGEWERIDKPTDGAPEPTPVQCEAPVLRDMFGFISCSVTCPNNLYHPVLPSKEGGKLVFDLMSPKRGTWTTVELFLALDMGYTLDVVYEIWDYEKTHVLFADYVGAFIRTKQKSGGYPKNVNTDEEKKQYKAEFFERFSMELGDVEWNPGLKAIAKLCLNSLWGKFGERCNQPQSSVVYSNDDLVKLVEDPRYIVSHVTPVTESATEVGYKLKDDFVRTEARIGCVNIPIAAFTTSHARIRLYEALDKLQEQVLYYDTDSVIFSHKPGQVMLDFGAHLGDWGDELDGGYIVGTFLSSGPKSYSYEYIDPKGVRQCTTKVKGFSLNVRNNNQINHEGMRHIVQSLGAHRIQTYNPFRIRLARNYEHSVSSKPEAKLFGFTYSKRHVLMIDDIDDNMDTVPFGHYRMFGQIQPLRTGENASMAEAPECPEDSIYDTNMEIAYPVALGIDSDDEVRPDVGPPTKAQRIESDTEDENENENENEEDEWYDDNSIDSLLENAAYVSTNDVAHVDYMCDHVDMLRSS